ncbi:MAG: GNAT family N-acetyltransferase [Chloroflexi bacterium]|nr:GNAT family N-acetyltransferase [Chloroflexota bacterium]
MQVLETERLILRRFSIEDADFILALLNEPSFMHFIGDRGVRTLDDARGYISNRLIESYERFGFGLYLTELKEPRTPIGMCGLIKRDTLEDVDIGFAFLPQFWSKGYAVEAASAVMDYGRSVWGLKRIVAIVSPNNERSINVLSKLGLTFERAMQWPDDGSEIELYASG